MPDVSIITTAYNAGPYIGAAIASVLAQRDTAVEHVIVDDGSTDGTREVVRAAGDSRVRLIEAGRVGRGRALNIGIGAATAPFIAILDADDLAHPDRVRVELDTLARDPSAVLVGSGQVLIPADGSARWDPVGRADAAPVNGALPLYNPLSHSSVMLHRAALEAIGGYDVSRRALFDWDMYIRLAATGGTLLKVSVPLVAKRIHGDQFFEGRRQFSYAAQCMRLQWRALADLKRSRLTAAAFPFLAAYRVAPRPLRIAVRKAVAAARRP